MALNLITRYLTTRIDNSDLTGYPYGKAQNVQGGVDGTGTPWEADIINDTQGFLQALLSEANTTPSGNADMVGASDYLDSLKTVIGAESASNIKVPSDSPYNAQGGGADDTAALQAYMDGEDIWYFDQDYTFTTTLTATDRKIVTIPSSGSLIGTSLTEDFIVFTRCDDSIIDGLNLDVSGLDAVAYIDAFRDAVKFDNCKNFTYQNSRIIGAPVQALNVLNGCDGAKIINNWILDAGRKQRRHAVSNISIGGGILCYNSKRVTITGNHVLKCWSTCIYYYGDAPVESNTASSPEQSILSNNILYYSQSNGIRIQDDNYDGNLADHNNNSVLGRASASCSVTGNVIIDVSRSNIRPNGVGHVVDGNVCIYTGQDIYGVSDIRADGIATNHGDGLVISNNYFKEVGAAIWLIPNGLVDFGAENIIVDNNMQVGCSYFLACAQGSTVPTGEVWPVTGITATGNRSYNPRVTHIQLSDTGDTDLTDNHLIGANTDGNQLPAIRLFRNGNITLQENKIVDALYGVTVTTADRVIANDNKLTNTKINGMSFSGITRKVNASRNDVDFGNLFDSSLTTTNVAAFASLPVTGTAGTYYQTDDNNKIYLWITSSYVEQGAIGITIDNCPQIRLESNDFESDSEANNSGLLLARSIDTVDVIGHVKNNTFDTEIGFNNQANPCDGLNLQQDGNVSRGVTILENETKVIRWVESSVSVQASEVESGTGVCFTSGGRALTIPAGLPIGYTRYVSSVAGQDFSIVNAAGSGEILQGTLTSTGGEMLTVTKITPAHWVVSGAGSAAGSTPQNTFVGELSLGGTGTTLPASWTSSKLGTGEYSVNTNGTTSYIATATSRNNGIITTVVNFGTSFEIHTYDAAGVATDAATYFSATVS